MADTPVAIVVPCYNAGSTLAATLESALVQDVPVEVVVVDDGSTDNSLAVARAFEPKVRVVTGRNQGASIARNSGIAATNTEWIVFLDADDMLEPGTLAKRLATARTANADVVICDWREMHDDGAGHITAGAHRSIDWPALEADAELATAVHVWATTAAILYRRAIVEKIGGFRPDLPVIQDAGFLFDAAYHGARFGRSDHIGARYRVLGNSLSRRNPGRFSYDLLVNGRHIEKAWRARGPLDDVRRKTVMGIYNTAGRSLFAAGHPAYFEAVEAQRSLGSALPLHSRLAPPIARLVGLCAAKSVFSLLGRE
ncbi:MAG TPA: glycosyltransferase [Xanthobacteraceae bacterium]|jgi:glycosyltransferase involved in cell wall biosynthesis